MVNQKKKKNIKEYKYLRENLPEKNKIQTKQS